jgi:hypothetical protein
MEKSSIGVQQAMCHCRRVLDPSICKTVSKPSFALDSFFWGRQQSIRRPWGDGIIWNYTPGWACMCTMHPWRNLSRLDVKFAVHQTKTSWPHRKKCASQRSLLTPLSDSINHHEIKRVAFLKPTTALLPQHFVNATTAGEALLGESPNGRRLQHLGRREPGHYSLNISQPGIQGLDKLLYFTNQCYKYTKCHQVGWDDAASLTWKWQCKWILLIVTDPQGSYALVLQQHGWLQLNQSV